jgi:hypothetical protein
MAAVHSVGPLRWAQQLNPFDPLQPFGHPVAKLHLGVANVARADQSFQVKGKPRANSPKNVGGIRLLALLRILDVRMTLHVHPRENAAATRIHGHGPCDERVSNNQNSGGARSARKCMSAQKDSIEPFLLVVRRAHLDFDVNSSCGIVKKRQALVRVHHLANGSHWLDQPHYTGCRAKRPNDEPSLAVRLQKKKKIIKNKKRTKSDGEKKNAKKIKASISVENFPEWMPFELGITP